MKTKKEKQKTPNGAPTRKIKEKRRNPEAFVAW
jgi:hypothetical protein